MLLKAMKTYPSLSVGAQALPGAAAARAVNELTTRAAVDAWATPRM
jgi:hypothetical protein